ncbi:NAD-dependent deacetylase sirtuin-4 [Thraustotheca clavata]|uniref:NAD-dependent deacetylase sirtuin-4 n=1 Tax=Thraustotheca clavata TaxID=74557 RepID=A0A1V9YZ61_9STRA|nr:NAD-dependent deacetylase sirtuin-4 [Thraustotheca clavata]
MFIHRFLRRSLSYVPFHEAPCNDAMHELQQILYHSGKVVVLTGAGISTESGVPDYRSKDVGLYARTNHKPIEHKEFTNNAHVRQRYWARNYMARNKWKLTQPNVNHHVLAKWQQETSGDVAIVTQNVDRLHHKAGSNNVIELHGSMDEVRCMNPQCSSPIMSRDDFQVILDELNPNFKEMVKLDNDTHANSMQVRPDADMYLSKDMERAFHVPTCPVCKSGFYKTNVVFFGDSVPRDVVEKIYHEVDTADAILVLGSSLHVFSGYRFLLRAKENKLPIGIVNIGPTRGDSLATVKVNAKCSSVLTELHLV